MPSMGISAQEMHAKRQRLEELLKEGRSKKLGASNYISAKDRKKIVPNRIIIVSLKELKKVGWLDFCFDLDLPCSNSFCGSRVQGFYYVRLRVKK